MGTELRSLSIIWPEILRVINVPMVDGVSNGLYLKLVLMNLQNGSEAIVT